MSYQFKPSDLTELADLIEQGSKLRGKAKGHLFFRRNGKPTSCALGAALEAAGIQDPNLKNWLDGKTWNRSCGDTIGSATSYELYRIRTERLPVLDASYVGKELPQYQGYHLVGVIMQLNDLHGWTREKIAQWLRNLKPEDIR